MRPECAQAARTTVSPDTLLVYRIAALSDKGALAELYTRHGMTLYAVAYSLAFDGEAADSAVDATFHAVWSRAACFDARAGSVVRWLADLTRRAVSRGVARQVPAYRGAPAGGDAATLDPAPA